MGVPNSLMGKKRKDDEQTLEELSSAHSVRNHNVFVVKMRIKYFLFFVQETFY